ncbi:hypothetical protein GCM10029978_056470 [Actinoallomurus acanthiterrae]
MTGEQAARARALADDTATARQETDEAVLRGLLIDGERVPAADGRTFTVVDPSSGAAVAEVSRAAAADVDRAVAAARAALVCPEWAGMRAADRGRLLARIAAEIRAQGEALARLESLDVGKPLREARADVEAAARYFEFYAGAADKPAGTTIPLGPGLLDYTVREPIGVSGQIIPFNYPLQNTARGAAPALAAGCTVVLKPSPEAPLSPLEIGRIAVECGLPWGVLNVVPGYGEDSGAALAGHPGHRPDHFHRLGRDRREGRSGRRRERRALGGGARRQVPGRRLRRRRLRPGAGRGGGLGVRQRRADLLGGHAAAAAARRGGVPRPAGQARGGDAARPRPVGSGPRPAGVGPAA